MDGPDVPPPKEEVKTESHDSAEAPTLKFEGSDAGETLTELLANGLAADGAGSDGGLAGLTDGNLLVNALHEKFDRLCQQHGGPVQWLLWKFDTPEKENAFREQLLQLFPVMTSIEYVVPSLLSKKEKTFVHVSMLSFKPESSTKGLPYSHTAKELVDEYLTHGFLTESQPLILWTLPRDKQLSQRDFRPRYVKGMCRSSTLLALLALMFDMKVDLLASFPQLYNHLQMIHALFETHADLASVAIANAHASNRGSIRAPHDVITWVCKLRKLQGEHGTLYSPTAILERFNQGATVKGKVVGNRRVSALALLQPACHAGLGVMIRLLSDVGLKAVWWSEDTFCNKKLLPGFTPRLAKTVWSGILQVTEDSFNCWVVSLTRQQLAKSAKNRKTLDKTRLEEHSALSAFWCWCLQQAKEHALDGPELVELHDKFVEGDVGLALDVQSLLHEKKGDIEFQDVFLDCLFLLPA